MADMVSLESRVTCGHVIAGATGPFLSVIGVSYYDGPTLGALRCAACRSPWKFTRLGDDSKHDTAIFALWRMTEREMSRLLELLKVPSLAPSATFIAPVQSWPLTRAEGDEVEGILNTSNPPDLVMAAQTLGGAPSHCRAPSRQWLATHQWAQELTSAQFDEWMEWLRSSC